MFSGNTFKFSAHFSRYYNPVDAYFFSVFMSQMYFYKNEWETKK